MAAASADENYAKMVRELVIREVSGITVDAMKTMLNEFSGVSSV